MIFAAAGPRGSTWRASFAPNNIFVGGFAGSAGIALAFAFASFIGFEATAIYGEESKDPQAHRPARHLRRRHVITVLFAVTAWAIVIGTGRRRSSIGWSRSPRVDGVPLADPAAVLFTVADEYVGTWLADRDELAGASRSLFAGLLAFQNSASRYFFAMGRGGVLPRKLDRVNKSGAPVVGSVTTSVITSLVIVFFIVKELDPVLNLFFWFSGMPSSRSCWSRSWCASR